MFKYWISFRTENNMVVPTCSKKVNNLKKQNRRIYQQQATTVIR